MGMARSREDIIRMQDEKTITTLRAQLEEEKRHSKVLEDRLRAFESTKIVYGFGICDADYPITKEEWVDGKKKRVWVCTFYRTWRNMISRCYRDYKLNQKPGYKDCWVCDEWKRFSVFKKWMEAQDWEGKELDKDILVPGNRIYSPEKCVFVGHELNSFVIDPKSGGRKYPIGVRKRSGDDKYEARCRNPFTKTTEYLGCFATTSEAHSAWKQRKHELACQYAETAADQRVAAALRSRYANHPCVRAAETEKGEG